MQKNPSVVGLAAGLFVLGALIVGRVTAQRAPAEVFVRVVEAESGTPVIGAEVRFLDSGTSAEPARRGRSGTRAHITTRLDLHGARLTTDAKGELRLPPVQGRAHVSASHAGLYDFRTVIPAREQLVLLELVPDVTTRVQVLDAAGKPCADVPVVLREPAQPRKEVTRSQGGGSTTIELGSGSRGPRNLMVIESAGAEAIAEFRHFQAVVTSPPVDRKLTFALDCFLAEPVEAQLEGEAWPTETLRLQLPETGELEVLLLDAEGEPVFDEMLSISLAPTRSRETNFGGEMMRFQSGRSAPEGRALFRFVGLGQEFEAWADRRWLGSPLNAIADGPTAAGARASLTLQLEGPDYVLRARAVDETGQPIAGEEAYLQASWSSKRERFDGYETVTTNDAGSFEVLLDARLVRHLDTCDLRLEFVDPRTRQTRSTKLVLPAELRPGVTDLGDVVVAAPKPFVSGVVVDADGNPVANAFIIVEVKHFTGPPPEDPEEERPFQWRPSQLSAMAGESGEFVIAGEVEGDQLRLSSIGDRGGKTPPLVVERGAEGVRLVLP